MIQGNQRFVQVFVMGESMSLHSTQIGLLEAHDINRYTTTHTLRD